MIEFKSSKPIYRQIIDHFFQNIVNGQLGPGDKLPSIRVTARNLRVNPNTVSRSFLEMDREGYTYTQRGKGTFITKDEEVLKNLKAELVQSHIQEQIDYLYKLGFSKNQIKTQLDLLLEARGNDSIKKTENNK